MSDFLTAGLQAAGLQQVDGDNNPVSAPAAPVVPEPVVPVAPVEPIVPLTPALPEPPAADTPVEVPEGARNPDAVQRAMEAERANARKHYARAKDLENELIAVREAALPLETRLANADARAKEAEHRALRLEVGLKHNIPIELADRLRGNTREEIEADVSSFLGHLNLNPTPTPVVPPSGANGGYQPQPVVKEDPSVAHGRWLAHKLLNPSGA